MYQINIDTKEISKLTATLRDMHRSAYPVAVRQTLNDLAFDVKQKQLDATAKQLFTIRNPKMIKAFSKVVKATGFDAGSMVAEVGMLNKGAGKTFDKQEIGGSYEHENIPLVGARSGGNTKGKVKKVNWVNIGRLDRSKANRNRSKKSQFVADAYMSKKLGLAFMFNKTLFKTISFKRAKGNLIIKTNALYASKKGQKVDVEGTKFVEKSAIKSITINVERFYKRAVNQQFKKYFK